MKHKLFDQFVKEQLSESRPEVPAGAWERIERELNRDRSRAFPFWLPGLLKVAAVLLITGGLAWYFLRDGVSDETLTEVAINNAIHQPTIVTGNANDRLIGNGQAKGNGVVAKPDNSDGGLNGFGTNASNRLKNFRAGISGKLGFDFTMSEPAIGSRNEQPVFSATDGLMVFNGRKNTDILTLLASERTQQKLRFPQRRFGFDIPCPEAERNAAGNKKYVELYAGPDMGFTHLSDIKDPAYAQRRKSTVSGMISYSAGARFTKVFGSGISVRGGINYTRINQTFTAEEGKVTQNVYITSHDGDTTGTYTVSGTRYTKNTNKYTLIDIPVTAGYEFGNGRVHTNLYAGVMINVKSKFEGNVIDRKDKAIDVSNSSGEYGYKTSAGTSLTAGASLYYKLNEKLHLMAEPYIRYGLNSVTPGGSSLKEKIHVAGIRAGLRLDL